MRLGLTQVLLIIISLLLASMFFFTAHKLSKLKTVNETLILRNDSLQSEQLQTKKEVTYLLQKIDSIAKEKSFHTSP